MILDFEGICAGFTTYENEDDNYIGRS